ncbi:MAG TPA: sulfurtransferase TusA family protein [Rhodospirillales bacterium]|jgi:tRNA 2-thiouridine synthesizing protein A|nr:sulfurtransferase TusA family protein [Rhodospirillales bacterium]
MDRVLDAKGLKCPLPVIKTRLALNKMAVGEVVTVLATDPASKIDIHHLCNITGNELVDASEEDGVLTYVIRRTEAE